MALTTVEGGVGEPPLLMVALHGYGDVGSRFARLLASSATTPRILVFSPSGPIDATLAKNGRAWYPLTAHRDEMIRRSQGVARVLRVQITETQRKLGISAERTSIVAFSQGTTVACALLDRAICARAVLLCGRVTEVPIHGRSPAILVVGGETDRFVPATVVEGDIVMAGLADTAQFLSVENLDHAMSVDLTSLAVQFATATTDPVATGNDQTVKRTTGASL